MKKVSVFFVLCTVFLIGSVFEILGKEKIILQQDERNPDLFFFPPNPEDTILYDSPSPTDTLGGLYWAVRFTPTGPCTVKAGLVSTALLFGAPICSLFVWDDLGGLPGPLVGGTPVPFAPTGFPTFDRIDLPSTYVDANDFWIGIYTEQAFNIAAALSDGVDGP
ncbi:hypothetical protein IIA15_06880, partial [candidate division TA06 bacterium]|nr:hypothetical protein [candidate division TA06 bacterium]